MPPEVGRLIWVKRLRAQAAAELADLLRGDRGAMTLADWCQRLHVRHRCATWPAHEDRRDSLSGTEGRNGCSLRGAA